MAGRFKVNKDEERLPMASHQVEELLKLFASCTFNDAK